MTLSHTERARRPALGIASEHARLEQVVMASPRHFRVVDPINLAQTRYFDHAPPPTSLLVAEQGRFVDALERAGVEVVWAPEQPGSPFQLNTRDVGAVVGNEFIVGRMRYPVRAREPDAVRDLLAPRAAQLVELPDGTFEGGDVLVDGSTVYVGLSQRTNETGAAHLSRHLAERGFQTVTVPLREDVLHLDVALNLVAPGLALAHTPALRDGVPPSIAATHEVIEVDDAEYLRLATNVFAIAPGHVVADSRNERVVDLLASRGIEVDAIDYEETTKIGGSFRCMTLPLRRSAEGPAA